MFWGIFSDIFFPSGDIISLAIHFGEKTTLACLEKKPLWRILRV